MPEQQIWFQSYDSRSKPFSQQRLVNMFFEKGTNGTKSQGILFKRPGYTEFSTPGVGPIRGIHTMNGLPFVVSGPNVYTIDSSGGTKFLGTIGGTGLVDMADNGTQVAIVSGASGWIAVPFVQFDTTLSATASIGDTVIRVTSVENMEVNDNIAITLDDTSVFTSTISAFAIDTTLSAAALVGDPVITVTSHAGTVVGDTINVALDDLSAFSSTITAFKGDTTISVNEAGGQTVIDVTSEAGMQVGDTIDITLNDTSIHSTTIASLALLTLTVALPSAADAGNLVEFFNSGTVKMADILAVDDAASGNAVEFTASDMVVISDVIAGDNAASGNLVEFDTPTLTQITDPNFRAVSSVTYQDGFFIWTEDETQIAFSSPLLDGLGPYDVLDFASAEYDSDNLVKAFSDHDDLFLFGEKTLEPWINTAASAFPFTPNSGTVSEVGLLARNTPKKIDNGLMFLGNAGERGGVSVWRIDGYQTLRVSTHALEEKFESFTDLQNAHAFTFRLEGHEFYVLTFPDQGTFVYDASSGLWCEWETFNGSDWNALGFSDAYGLKLVGDSRLGKIYSLSIDTLDDAGTTISCEAISAQISSENNYRDTHNFLRVDMEMGVGLTAGQGSDPQMWLSWTTDDEVFGNKHLLSIGKKGERRIRAYRNRLGSARNRAYKWTITDPVRVAIYGAYVDITPGIS